MTATIEKIETVDQMSPEYRDCLVGLLLVQADAELASVQLIRPWLDQAPTVDDRWLLARRVTDAVQHAASIYRILKPLGAEAQMEQVLARKIGEHALDAFNMPLETWPDLVLFSFLIDRVGVYQLREFVNSSYAPLARAVPKMVEEKTIHMHYGQNLLTALCQTDSGKKQAQAALRKWYPRALDMFGSAESKRNQQYRQYGLKKKTNEEARQSYVADVGTILREQAGLEVPPPEFDRRIL